MSKRKALHLSLNEKEELKKLGNSRTGAAVKIRRAKILLLYSDG